VGVNDKDGIKRPVFFIQNRSGKNYKTFKCWKFRTMRVTDGDDDFVRQQKWFAHYTGGKYLRKLNFDELPQFINVFLGEMSVVGPRPHPIKLNEATEILWNVTWVAISRSGHYRTCTGSGFRGETADPELMNQRVLADVFYIENWSLLLDIKIILLTIWNMVRGEKNAYWFSFPPQKNSCPIKLISPSLVSDT